MNEKKNKIILFENQEIKLEVKKRYLPHEYKCQ